MTTAGRAAVGLLLGGLWGACGGPSPRGAAPRAAEPERGPTPVEDRVELRGLTLERYARDRRGLALRAATATYHRASGRLEIIGPVWVWTATAPQARSPK